eukprot:212248-Pelagomonas_calceolata.AAC.1
MQTQDRSPHNEQSRPNCYLGACKQSSNGRLLLPACPRAAFMNPYTNAIVYNTKTQARLPKVSVPQGPHDARSIRALQDASAP